LIFSDSSGLLFASYHSLFTFLQFFGQLIFLANFSIVSGGFQRYPKDVLQRNFVSGESFFPLTAGVSDSFSGQLISGSSSLGRVGFIHHFVSSDSIAIHHFMSL